MKYYVKDMSMLGLVFLSLADIVFFVATIGQIGNRIWAYNHPRNGPSNVMDTSFLIPAEKGGNVFMIFLFIAVCIFLLGEIGVKVWLFVKACREQDIGPLVPFALICVGEMIFNIQFNSESYISGLKRLGFNEQVTNVATRYTVVTTIFLFLPMVANAIFTFILSKRPDTEFKL